MPCIQQLDSSEKRHGSVSRQCVSFTRQTSGCETESDIDDAEITGFRSRAALFLWKTNTQHSEVLR